VRAIGERDAGDGVGKPGLVGSDVEGLVLGRDIRVFGPGCRVRDGLVVQGEASLPGVEGPASAGVLGGEVVQDRGRRHLYGFRECGGGRVDGPGGMSDQRGCLDGSGVS